MAKVSGAGMLVPGDFDVESAAIARKRTIAEALIKQSMAGNQGQMVSGHYVAPSWAENLASLGSAYLGNKRSKELDERENTAKDNYQTGLGDAVKQYMDTRNGSEREVPLQGPTQDGGVVEGFGIEAIPADPRKAIVEAMTSQYRPLQQLGAADMASMGKGVMTSKDILDRTDATMSSRLEAIQNGNNPAFLKPVAKTHVINNKLVKEGADEGAPVVTGEYGDTYGEVGAVGTSPTGTPILGQKETRSGKVAFAPTGTTVNVDNGQGGAKAFATEAAKDLVKRLTEGQELAKKAQQGFETFSNAATQIKDVPGGLGANVVLGAKKFLAMMGVDDPSITSTEQVRAALGQAVLDNAKALGSGSGFSNTDREFLQKIVLGEITLDAASLQRAVDIGLANNLNVLREHEQTVDKSKSRKDADPQTVEGYRVAVPNFSLDAERFDYSPQTRRLTVKTSGGRSPNPANGGAVPTAPQSGPSKLTPAEQSELQALRARFKGVQQ